LRGAIDRIPSVKAPWAVAKNGGLGGWRPLISGRSNDGRGAAMFGSERRGSEKESAARLRTLLNEDQLMTLVELEQFGWSLKFVRRPMFQPSIPVVIDADRKRYAVLEADGTLNENPGFTIRD
jgi:hypothetical protein